LAEHREFGLSAEHCEFGLSAGHAYAAGRMFGQKGSTTIASHRVLLIPLALVLLSGCPSLSTLQTPSTVPKGHTRFGIGAEAVHFSDTNDDNGSSFTLDIDTFPQLEFSARYGLTDDIDIGAKLYALGVELGLKYQFLRGPLDIAIAPAASYATLDSGGGEDSRVHIVYLHAPLLLGYNVSDSVTLGFGPKLLLAAAIGSTDATDTGVFAGGVVLAGGFVNLPLRVGNAFWIAPEINVYTPIGESRLIWQGGLVFLFGGPPPPVPTSNP
jgi:hypothetical protein